MADITGDFRDNVLVGTEEDDVIRGREGNDVLRGLGGSDLLDGGPGADRLEGGPGDDDLQGGGDDDLLDGGAGVDSLDGGRGSDTVRYDWALTGLVVDLRLGTADLDGAQERLSSIERVLAGAGDDLLIGDAADNVFAGGAGDDRMFGGAGDDVFDGGGGDDFFHGGPGLDIVVYAGNARPVAVDLARQVVRFPEQRSPAEFMASIEGAVTGAGNDELLGNAAANVLVAGAGDDRLVGRGGDDRLQGGPGADTLDGGPGRDTADFSDLARVAANLAAGLAVADGGREQDRLVSIEHLTGSPGADLLIGNAAANHLEGLGGDDTLVGGAGDDVLSGGSVAPTVFTIDSYEDDYAGLRHAPDGADVIYGGPGRDTLVLPSTRIVDLQYSTPVDYVRPLNPSATVNLSQGIVYYGGDHPTDRIAGIENVRGTHADEVIIGTPGANVIETGEGQNRVYAGAGDDVVRGGTYVYGYADTTDELYGGAGNDTLVGNGAFGMEQSIYSVELIEARDYLDGGDGDDRLVAGLGWTDMAGGDGADEFRFAAEQRAVFYRPAEFSEIYLVQRGRVLDFAPEDGDRLAIALTGAYGSETIRFGGRKAAAEAELFELTWDLEARADGATDTVVQLAFPNLAEDAYEPVLRLVVRLDGHGEGLAPADVLLV